MLISRNKELLGNNKWYKIEFQLIITFSILGIYFIISSLDLLSIYISLEIFTFSSIILVLIKNSKITSYISIIYFFINAIASCIILLGFYYLYRSTGNLNLLEYKFILNYQNSYNIELDLIIIGLIIKLAIPPFHFWLMTLYDSIPYKITLFQSLIPKLVYLILLNNIIYYSNINNILYLFIVYSIFLGSILGINNNKIKKILASSSILNVGFLLLGIITQSNEYNITHIFGLYIINIINIFLILLLFINLDSLYDLKYIKFYYPFISFFLLISILSLIGIPFFSGFYYKIIILYNSLKTYNILIYFIIFISIISFVLSSNFYLYFIKTIYNNFYYYFNNTILDFIYPSLISYWIIITSLLIIGFPLIINQYFLLLKFILI